MIECFSLEFWMVYLTIFIVMKIFGAIIYFKYDNSYGFKEVAELIVFILSVLFIQFILVNI